MGGEAPGGAFGPDVRAQASIPARRRHPAQPRSPRRPRQPNPETRPRRPARMPGCCCHGQHGRETGRGSHDDPVPPAWVAVPWWKGDAGPHKPAERQIVFHLRHELSLRADRKKDLEQACPDQPFRSNRGMAEVSVERRKCIIQAAQSARHRDRTGGASMAHFATCRILGKGSRARIRASITTWLNSDPHVSSPPA